ncbi:MAG: glycosyltransferase [Actinomycetota bacterium]|nr:glycosyltransferase [Actinomycetota bacterium]
MPSPFGLARAREQWERLRAARADMRAARILTEALVGMASDSAAIAAETALAVATIQGELSAVRAELSAARADLVQAAEAAAANQERTLLGLRMVRDNDAAARAALWALRSTAEYEAAFDEAEPLVTILITTYMNWPLLRDRSLPSVLAQTYERFEAIVIGDAAPDETRRVVESFGDERLRFVNLPYRGPYPDNAADAWRISGTTPFNTGFALARGRWIGSNSDDDALRPRCVESLLAHARETRSEVPYGYIDQRKPDEPSDQLGTFPPSYGQWGIQSSLLHSGLGFLPLQPSDWVFGIPNDISLLERMLRIGIRFSMIEEPVVDYYPSQLWSARENRLLRRETW